MENLLHVFTGHVIALHNLLRPLSVLGNGLAICAGGQLLHHGLRQLCHFRFQAAGQNCQTHHFNQSDVLFLDVMELGMGMVNTHGMLLSGDVVPQHQIQLKILAPLPGNGGNGIVGLPLGLGKDEALRVRIAPPCCQNLACQLHQAAVILAAQADAAHGPVDDTGGDIFKPGKAPGKLYGCLLHGEGIPSALEMVVAQDAAAHNGQVGVGANKIVGELLHKVQQLPEGGIFNLHGGVLLVEDDAMLVIVHIGAVLQAPGAIVDGHGNDPVILSGGMVHPSGVALVFHAQLALGIAALGGILGCCNGLGVLLRLAQVDGDVQIAIGGGGDPLHVPGNPIPADVVGVLAEIIVPIRCRLGALVVQLLKGMAHHAGPGSQAAHQLGIKQLPCRAVVLADAPLDCVLGQHLQHFMKCQGGCVLTGGILVQPHGQKKLIADENLICGLDEMFLQAVFDQLVDCICYHSVLLFIQ